MLILENILSQEIVQKLGWTLLHFIWQAMVIALILAILLKLLRKSTPSLRYIFACLTLGLIVLLPVITIQLVPVSVPQMATHIEPAPAPAVLSSEEMPPAETTIVEEPEQLESVAPISADSWKQRTIKTLEPALPYIVSGWLVGVFGLSVWHLGGWTQLQRLKRRMVKQVDDTLHSKLKVLAQRLRVKQTVQLMESALVQIPTVVGWLRPVILLPASALTGLTSEQLEAILAHELAHIKRVDYLINILQTVVEILGFYHPAVWWVSHKIRAERENCCDDLAVSISGDRVCYAGALTSMEEIRAGRGQLAVAATGGDLFKRICRLVGKDSAEKTGFSWIPAATAILLIAALLIPTTLALTTHNRIEDPAKSLLDKMLEHRSKVKNVQFVAEYDIWHAGYSEEFIENIRKSMRERGIPEQQLQRTTRGFSQVPQSRYQILKCTIDNEERAKIERTTGTYDSSGKKLPSGDKNISAWNGVLGTDFNQRRGSTGAATFKDAPPTGASRQGHPWKTFTGAFCSQLAEAINAERQISVDELKDGTYRVVFDDDLFKRVAVIDPSQSYSCSLQESYKEDQLTYRSTAKYIEVAKGIWFPVSGQTESYASDGSLRSKSTIKTSQIKINYPAFNKSFFDVDLPEGTEVRDTVQGKHYVVGSKNVYELPEPQQFVTTKPEDTTDDTEAEIQPEIDLNAWQKAFYAVYRLKDGEILKRIAPPFIPERRGYFLFIQPGRYSPNTPHHVARLYFNWDGKLSIRGSSVGGGIPRLNSILGSVIGLGNREYDIPLELLYTDMSGDWIVRKGTPQEELLQALEQIIKEETGRDIDFVKQKVETEVIVARGKYDFRPLSGVKKKDSVHIYADKVDAYQGAGGGSGTLSKFLRWVGNRVRMNIINETETEGVDLSWRNHHSSDLSRLGDDAELYNQRLDLLLKNLSRQTGLTFQRETATVEKWFISEKGTIKAPQKADAPVEDDILIATASLVENIPPAPVLAKSPAPFAEDKAHVQIDCLIVEVFTDSKMDRETTIVAENTLGNKISLRGIKADVSLRKAAKATAATKDKSAENKRVTQEQFKAFVEMLISKGYLRILMNPRIQVVDGKTAKILSTEGGIEDSIQITPHVFADGRIILEVEAAINSKSIPKGVEQIPIITTREISTRVRTSPGQSLIIGGLTEKDPAPGDNVKNSKKRTAEVLFILTPTIITSAPNQQKKPDVQVEGESEVSKLLASLEDEKYAHTRGGIIPLVEEIGNKEPTSFLVEQLQAESRRRRCKAALVLELLGDRRGVPVIIKELNDTSYRPTTRIKSDGTEYQEGQVREDHYYAALLLGILGDERAVTALIEATRDETIDYQAAMSLGQIGDKRAIPALRTMLKKRSNNTLSHLFAGYGLAMLGDNEGIKVVIETLNNHQENWTIRRHAIEALGKLRDKEAVPYLTTALKDEHPNIRVSAARALGAIGGLSALPALKQALEDKTETKVNAPTTVSKAAAEAIAQIRTERRSDNEQEKTKSATEQKPQMVQKFFKLKNYSPSQMAQILKPLLTKTGYISADERTNNLLVIDTVENLMRIEKIIAQFDVSIVGQTVTEFFEIRYGDPTEIVELLKKLINGRPDTGAVIESGKEPIVLIPEPRRKWIIAKGSAENMKQIGEWIEKLDREEPAPASLEQIEQQIIKQQKILKMRQDCINNDPVVKALSENVANADKELIVARQKFTQLHPEVQQKAEYLQVLKKRLDDRITALGKSFDDMMLPEPNLPLAPEVPLITNTWLESDMLEVLQDIASMAGIPIIPDETVVGLVTAELQNVPLDTALDIVLAGTPYVVKKTPYYYLVASAVEPLEISKRMESARKLSNLGKALLIYANDHEDKYPDSLHHLPEYLNVEELKWVLANVKYLAHGKTIADRPDTVIAYDKMLLTEGKGTNVLFNDSHVSLEKVEELKKLGISAVQILITTHILSVSEDFLKDIGLDAKSISSSNAWSEHLVADSAADPNSETYSLILDDLNVRLLLKAVQAHQGSKMLSAPQVMTREGTTAEIAIITEEHPVLDYNEPNGPSDEPEPKKDKVEIGTRIWLKPELTPDKENVRLDFKLEIRQLLGYEERKYKGKYKYIVPRTEVVSTQTQLLVPDGKTLLIGGLKIIEQVKSRSGAPLLSKIPVLRGLFKRSTIKEPRMLLVLVKPIINPQQKARKILRGQEDSEEHIKSLARQLEKKLNPPAD